MSATPHPVSFYLYGDKAEAEARTKADDLRGRNGIRGGVTVDRISRPKGRGGIGKLTATSSGECSGQYLPRAKFRRP